MAFCIQFKLIEIYQTTAKYMYSDCSDNFEGIFELNLENYFTNELFDKVSMSDVVKVIKPCLREGQSQPLANRAFSKIYKHYQKTGKYLREGGYYA